MENKKVSGFGFRGWMLIVYQAAAFFAWMVFANYPINFLSDLHGGAQAVSMVYTISTVICVLVQLIYNKFIGKVKNIKNLSIIYGLITLLTGAVLCFINVIPNILWLLCYAVCNFCGGMWATFTVGILVGQWFPTRKGTIMGIATFAMPIGNGLTGVFATLLYANGSFNLGKAFLPFYAVSVAGWLIGLIFLKDYPEQCGCYRDNDRTMTADIAKAMMEQEIENKKSSVWGIGRVFASSDFWKLVIPSGFLVMFSASVMMQSSTIIGQYSEELSFVGGYTGTMAIICVVGCFGSWLVGVLDTKLGTKNALMISVGIMILSGILGAFPSVYMLFASFICLALFMGAGSNFSVSFVAQYWRGEDFGNVFSISSPVVNVFSAFGPSLVALLMVSSFGYRAIFICSAVMGVISMILLLSFKPSHVKVIDDKYRLAAGKPIDDALVGRK